MYLHVATNAIDVHWNTLFWWERDNVVYWKTKRKINNDLQCFGENKWTQKITQSTQKYILWRATKVTISKICAVFWRESQEKMMRTFNYFFARNAACILIPIPPIFLYIFLWVLRGSKEHEHKHLEGHYLCRHVVPLKIFKKNWRSTSTNSASEDPAEMYSLNTWESTSTNSASQDPAEITNEMY